MTTKEAMLKIKGYLAPSNNNKGMSRLLIIIILAVACASLTFYFQNIDFGRVYTHLFYIPIVLACIWWERRGVLVALGLGAVLIAFHFLFRQEVPLANDLLRSLSFFIVAVFVSEVSRLEKIKSYLLKAETQRAQNYLHKIGEKERRLNTSFLGLAFKNQDIEKLQQDLSTHRLTIENLKKQISKLQKQVK